MKFPVVLGALVALVIGGLAVVGVLSALSAREPTIPPAPPPTVVPGEFGFYTPPPSEPAAPRASPTASATAQPDATTGADTDVGERAPILQLPDLRGRTIDTSAVEGPLWINFMATWCPSCRYELPMMEQVQLRNDELEIILVDVAERPDTVRDFMADLGIDLPVALDEDGAASVEWGAYALPVHYFIDGEGVVQEVVFGGAPQEIMNEAIRTVLPEAKLGDLEE